MGNWRVRRVRRLLARSRDAGPSGIWLLCHTFCLLLAAKIALRMVPVEKIITWKQRPLARPQVQATPEDCLRVRQAVLTAAHISPIQFVCFPRCLAASELLHRAGIESRLHYGVAREDDKLITHTWLEACGEILIGGEVAEKFSTLAVY